MNRWEGLKSSCVQAPPLVHDVVQCFLIFNEGVAHTHTSLELYLPFYSMTKGGENKGDSSGEEYHRVKILFNLKDI